MTTYVPGSNVPFKPLNPHGRPMPKPSREMRKTPPSMFQVQVEEISTGRLVLVGPRTMQSLAERLCEMIGTEIAHGREKSWANPTIVETRAA